MPPTQRRVLERMHAAMKPGGLLFVGHSENFADARDLFRLRGKTVYERSERATLRSSPEPRRPASPPPRAPLARGSAWSAEAQPRRPGEASFFFYETRTSQRRGEGAAGRILRARRGHR